jgi:hypothetical protein
MWLVLILGSVFFIMPLLLCMAVVAGRSDKQIKILMERKKEKENE